MYKDVSDLHVGSYINCKDLILYKKALHSLVNALFVIYLIGNMTQIHLNILLNKHFFFLKRMTVKVIMYCFLWFCYNG